MDHALDSSDRRTETHTSRAKVLAGGGEMGERIRNFDWSQTPLGPIDTWPQSLKTAVQILLNSRYPMFVWWGAERINIYNDAYAPILGARHPQALGQSAPQIWSDIWDIVGPQADVVMLEGRATWNESLLLVMARHWYIEETYFTFSYSPAPDDDGGVGGLFCVCTEDTARVLGERRLKTLNDLGERSLSEARTVEHACRAAAEALAENPNDFPFALIYLLDDSGRQARLIETINIPAGTHASPAIISLDEEDVWNIGGAIATNQSQLVGNLDARFGRLPAGAWTDDSTTSALVMPLAAAGSQTFPAGIFVAGISPRLALNDEYRSFVELAAKQLASAIANAQAYENERKRAEALAELDRAKTAFFSNVSHEFRTPLTLLLGPLEDTMAGTSDMSPANRERVEVAHRNALRLLRLVNTLLDFSRIEAGRTTAAYEPTDLAALTADLASVFRSAVERAGLRLVVDCPPLPEMAYVDREMWEKIVFNLLSNAFKFTFEGEIAVALRQTGEMVELSVRDTGAGIPADELQHLFERFHRVEGARGRTFEGSGIGLALVQELVKQHGGAVRVESEVDRGSTFVVSIPLGYDHLPADRLGSKPDTARAGTQGEAYIEEALRWLPDTDFGLTGAAKSPEGMAHLDALQSKIQNPKPKILLADDNADMREYVQRLLSLEYNVVAVGDGAAALRAAQATPFDLVLTDVMMPELDGFGLLKALRDDERHKTTSVIILSARAGEEARVEGVEAGAEDYLVKPFSARELLARVRTHLELSRIRRESHLEIERQAQLFDTTLSSLSDCIFVFDRAKRFIYANRALQQLWGMQAREYAGKTLAELQYPSEVVELLSGQLDQVFETKQAIGGVLPFIGSNGASQYWEYLFSPVIGADGMVDLVAGASRDITERKRGDDALRASQAGLALALQAGHAGTFEWDILDDINYWSPELEALYDVAPGTFEGNYQAWASRIEPDDERMVSEGLQAALQAQEREYSYEFRAILPDGRRRWLAGRARFDYNDEGAPLRMIGINVDIHERKQAELNAQFLLDLDTHINRLSEAVEIEQAVVDRLGEYMKLSRCYFGHIDGDRVKVEQEWKQDDTPVVGQYALNDYFSPEVMQQFRENMVTIVEDVSFDSRTSAAAERHRAFGIRAFVVVPIVHHQRWVGALNSVSSQPRRWSADEVHLLRDVAAHVWPLLEQAQSRAALRESEARLQVLYAQEQTARAQAEEASRLKDEFLATVSHELRTPLTAFLGYAQMLQSRKRDEAYTVQALGKMVRSARNQAQLIEDLLDVSRIVSGKLHMVSSRIDLRDVIQASLDTMRPAIEAKALDLHIDVPSAATEVVGDANRLQQVVWNLLSNATKFTPLGGSIDMRLETHDSHAQLSVCDTGQGIRAEFLPYVFERFRQAEAASNRAHGGLGLGLSIVRHVVELHGGTVQAFSDGEGQGACFEVWLPLASRDRETSRAIASVAPDGIVEESCQPELDGLRVLIVDDQHDILELLEEILTPCGAVVRTCETARGALETLREWRPDVLVSDIAMPGEDGYWLIRQLRALPADQGGAIPAGALTAYVRLEERMRVLAAGFQMYVPKPVEPVELLNVVASLAQTVVE